MSAASIVRRSTRVKQASAATSSSSSTSSSSTSSSTTSSSSSAAAAAAADHQAKKTRRKRQKVLKLPEGDLDWALHKSDMIIKRLARFLGTLRKHSNHFESAGEWNAACYIFAQFEAGSAVCVSADGHILTCYHCLGDDPSIGEKRCVIGTNGDICLTEAVKLDPLRDLALIRVTGIYDREASEAAEEPVWVPRTAPFPFVRVLHEEKYEAGESIPCIPIDVRAMCIGQPGQESPDSIQTGYNFVHISTGRYRGVVDEEANIHDNTDIGQLVHDCWTYWGHSGAPVMVELPQPGAPGTGGRLIGLHSSWDDETGTRHGVHLLAILAFLKRRGIVVVNDDDDEDDSN